MSGLMKRYNKYIVAVTFILSMVASYINQGRHSVVFLLPIIFSGIILDLKSAIGVACLAWIASYTFTPPDNNLDLASVIARCFFFLIYAVLTHLVVKKQTSAQDSIIRELASDLDLNKTLQNLILNDSKSALEVVDAEGKIVNWNRQAAELTGVADAVNKVHEYIFNQPEETGQNIILETLRTGKEYRDQEIMLLFPDREPVHALVNTYALRDNRNTIVGALALYRDITEKKMLERKIYQEEKFAALGQMAAGLAHEIRNPLTTVKGFLQLSSPADPKDSEYRDLMLAEINRTNKLISDFVLLANPSAPLFKAVCFAELIDSILIEVRKLAQTRNITLVKELESLPEICVDQEQIRHLFLNLIYNAFDAMPDGGTLAIKAKALNKYCQIQVQDTGVGIPVELNDKIFDPFFTTKESGTGLGLSISYHIVRNHGGTIDVNSYPGCGTTFTITLPFQPGRD